MIRQSKKKKVGLGLLVNNVVPSTLVGKFIMPPFSVFDARKGYWQKRKRQWLSLGIKSELGRGRNMLDMSASSCGITDEEEKAVWNKARRESLKHKKPTPDPSKMAMHNGSDAEKEKIR